MAKISITPLRLRAQLYWYIPNTCIAQFHVYKRIVKLEKKPIYISVNAGGKCTVFTPLLQLKFLVQIKSKWESCPSTISLPSHPDACCPHVCISFSSSLEIPCAHACGMTSSWSPHPHLSPQDSPVSLQSPVRTDESCS